MVLTESESIALEELAEFLENDFIAGEEIASIWVDETKTLRKLLSAQKRLHQTAFLGGVVAFGVGMFVGVSIWITIFGGW